METFFTIEFYFIYFFFCSCSSFYLLPFNNKGCLGWREGMLGDDMEYHSHSTCCSWFYNSYDNIANNAGRSCEIIYTNVHKYNLFPWKIYICFSYSFFFYLFNRFYRSIKDNRGERMLVLKKKKIGKKDFEWKKILTFWPVDTIVRGVILPRINRVNWIVTKANFRCRISSQRVTIIISSDKNDPIYL